MALFLEESDQPLGKLTAVGPLHPACTGMYTYSGYEFAFPAHRASVSTAIWKLTECLIHWHKIPHNIASDHETHFAAEEVQKLPLSYRIHWLYYILQYIELAKLVDRRHP